MEHDHGTALFEYPLLSKVQKKGKTAFLECSWFPFHFCVFEDLLYSLVLSEVQETELEILFLFNL